jgi:antirestriction protein ArdC
VWLLELSAAANGFSSPYSELSFKQAKAKGGKVRKGEHGTMVVFWKILRKKTDEIDAKTGKPVVKSIPLLRYYHVFNADQIDGLKLPAAPWRADQGRYQGTTPRSRASRIVVAPSG